MAAEINNVYFSGAQTSIYIGDIWIDDINSINYTVQQSTTPIYGYGSQHYDLLPKGQILISGSFRINFKEPNYLWIALKAAQRYQIDAETVKRKKIDDAKIDWQKTNVSFEQDKRNNLDIFLSGDGPSIEALKARFSTPKVSSLTDIPKSAGSNIQENMNHSLFNITLGYGTSLNSNNNIGEMLEGVMIVGSAKQIETTGQPIQEEYQFIARRKR